METLIYLFINALLSKIDLRFNLAIDVGGRACAEVAVKYIILLLYFNEENTSKIILAFGDGTVMFLNLILIVNITYQ